MSARANGVFYASSYHPIQAGSIDGTDITPHDNAVYRALLASSAGLYDATGDPKAEGDPYCTLFVGCLSENTDERSLADVMSKYGRVKRLRLVRHIGQFPFIHIKKSNKMIKCRLEILALQNHSLNLMPAFRLMDISKQLYKPG
jgi:hypothetical protein